MNSKYFYQKVKSGLLLLMTIFLLTSCEEYLEEQPSTLIDLGFVFNTEEGLKSGIVSLYTFNRDRYERNIQDYMGTVLMSTRADLTFSRSGYTGNMGRYERGVSPIDLGSQFTSPLFWKNYYKIANKATDIINAAEVIEGVDENTKNQIIAEAKFFRANAYFYLYRMYNNIYVSTTSITVDNAFDLIQDKSSKEEIFALLNSDLNFAIENLDWNVSFGRVSKGTAKHVKAKVAMWEGDYEEAKTQALSVIEDPESPFSLVATTADVFKDNRDHSEQLFTVRSEDNVLGGGSGHMMNANYVAQYFQIPGIIPDSEQGGRGFSRVVPNRYLLGLLAEDENDTRDDNTYFRLHFFYNDGENVPDGKKVGDTIDIYKPISEENPEGVDYQRYYQRLAPSCVKFAQADVEQDTYFQQTNIIVYRLAETYLIAAEALMRTGGDGLPYINAVRERAEAAPLEELTLQAIMDENARELSFEGERFFFLKRLGSDILNEQMRTYAGDGEFYPRYFGGEKDPRVNWQDHYINYPIFQEDLDLLGPNYPQNDGY
ncbi:RagB/SusD family nutrient uptake outer membrane protein [Aureibaculum algae]|uniref:RagB/SusD family nutrient uptake outer membrane protein n=1 Tax=Aureibaculum algae TaxID=2584122 RepID=A0A5B7TPQ6_9FLAO|nr:RagB/SusD family nutrient uptake outer membrane protein [Aureibaculum algae]QCX36897.1 RagB/SusD family nutrient uptake outer membrane protein [Aureibaculum algae]